MLEIIQNIDKEIFLFLNGLHFEALDPIMFYLSSTGIWIPFYLFLVWILFKNYNRNVWVPLLFIGLAILLADKTTSGFMKPFFERLRPSHEPDLQGLVHHVFNYKGGAFGFASSHAANTFALALFFITLLGGKMKIFYWMILWAAVVSYTRIYLGVHYPGDILVGGLLGSFFGWITAFACKKILSKYFINASGA